MPSTFSWTASNGTTLTDNWNDTTAWTPTPVPGDFTGSSNDFFIVTSANLVLTNFGNNLAADAVTVDDPNALLKGTPNTWTVTDFTLTNGIFKGTSDSGQTTIGNGSTAGVLDIGSGGLFEGGGSAGGGSGYTLDGNGGAGPAQITGSGTVEDIGGFFATGSNINLESGTFAIADNLTNEALFIVAGNIDGGGIAFQGATGLLGFEGSIAAATPVSGLINDGSNTLSNGIDIINASTVTSAVIVSNVMTVVSDAGTFTFTLTGADYSGDTVATQADSLIGGGVDVFLVCYAAGTAILTDHGDTAVESLEPGDTVMTLANGVQVPKTVKWVGRRDLDMTRHPNPDSVAPVRIMAGALGDNLPSRDLVLSPDHCLFIDGALFPAKLLINDMTIVRDLTMKTVSYFHVELDRHAVMIAEGVAAESYLDTGNRAFFSNAGLATILHPELNINENLRCWNTDACAPLTVKPELVKPVWTRIADRAVALGFAAPVHATTRDAGIHLMVDGKVVRPLVTKGKTVSFMVPGNARSVRLVSRATRQSALTPWLDDPRTLGVAIRSVTLRDTAGELVLSADHPALRDGWHAAEHMENGAFWRWSSGDAVLPLVTSGPCMMEIALSETATYIESTQRLAA